MKLSSMCFSNLLDLFVPAVWHSQLTSGKMKLPIRTRVVDLELSFSSDNEKVNAVSALCNYNCRVAAVKVLQRFVF